MKNVITTSELLKVYYDGLAKKGNWDSVISEDFKFKFIGRDMTKRDPVIGKPAYMDIIKKFSKVISFTNCQVRNSDKEVQLPAAMYVGRSVLRLFQKQNLAFMIKKIIFFQCLLFLSFSGAAQGKSDADKLNKLAAFVGEWRSYSTVEKSVAGTDTVVTKCNWSPTRRYLLCDQVVKAPNGIISTDLAIFSYDADRKEYQFYVVGISGSQPFSSPLDIKENIWTYSGEYLENGKMIKNRTLNIFNDTGTEVKYVVQISKDDGKTWETTNQGREIRISK